ncbi:hypothetical protein ISS312_02395 [Alteromonas mediterranea]|nr:hypothetical protein ISS312_02395 [Alteromonas mediterranea]
MIRNMQQQQPQVYPAACGYLKPEALDEKNRFKVKKVVFWALLLFIVLYSYFYLKGQFEIDSCLDKGGKWDYVSAHCLFAE